MAGLHSGTMIFLKIPNSVQPSIRPASSSFGKRDKEGAHHENTKGIGCPRKDQSRIRIDKAKFKNFNVERNHDYLEGNHHGSHNQKKHNVFSGEIHSGKGITCMVSNTSDVTVTAVEKIMVLR
mgnify:FL=1